MNQLSNQLSNQIEITIFHTTDIHGRIIGRKEEKRIGISRIATFLKKLRNSKSGEFLLFNTGDSVSGDPLCDLTKGVSLFQSLNFCEYTASNLGNHDFDFGSEKIKSFVETAQFPILCANILSETGDLLTGKGYEIFIHKGLKILVVGILAKEPFDTIKTYKKSNVTFCDPYQEIKRILREKEYQFDLSIALSHGFPNEDMTLICKDAAVDIILSGHDHAVSTSEYKKITQNDNLIKYAAHTGSNTIYIGKIDIKYDIVQQKIVAFEYTTYDETYFVTHEIEDHPDIAKIVEEVRNHNECLGKTIAHCQVDLYDKNKIRKLTEKAIRSELKTNFAYLTDGGFRGNFYRGDITFDKVWDICPFDDVAYIIQVKGRDLTQKVKERLQSLDDSAVIEDDHVYSLATNDYAIEQKIITNNSSLSDKSITRTDRQIRDVLIDCLTKIGVIQD